MGIGGQMQLVYQAGVYVDLWEDEEEELRSVQDLELGRYGKASVVV